MSTLPGNKGPLQGVGHAALTAGPNALRPPASRSISLNTVAAQSAGASFAISGKLAGYKTAPTLQYQLNGGTALNFPSSPVISADLSTYSAVIPGLAAGTVKLAVQDVAHRVTSNVASVKVQAPAPGGGTTGLPGALPVVTIQANTAQAVGAPISFGHVFTQGDVPGSYTQRLVATTPDGHAMPLQAAQTNVWPDGSLRYATLFGRSPIAFAAGQKVAFQLGTASSAIAGTPLTPAQVAKGWSQHTFGGDYTSHLYSFSATTPPSTTIFTGVNSDTITMTGGGSTPLVLTQPAQAGDQIGMALTALPSSAATYTGIVQVNVSAVPHCNAGLTLRNSRTGFIANLIVQLNTRTVGIASYTSPTAYYGSFGTNVTSLDVTAPLALRIAWDGTSYTFLVSPTGDANSWIEVWQTGTDTLGSFDQIGFFIDNFAVNGGMTGTLTVSNWEVTPGANRQAASTGRIAVTSVADTFTVDAADVVATMPQYTLAQNAGSYPLGYWELVSQGPVVTEIKVKRYLKRDGDGASHAWDQAVLYLRAWSDGKGGILGYHVLPSLRSENVYGANPSGTIGGANQANRRGVTELRLNGQVVKAVGGPNDPSGLATALLQPQCGWFGANMDGSIPWTGSVPAPSFMVAHDLTYLFRKTKMFPPYKMPVGTNAAQDYTLTETFIPGAFGSASFVPYGEPGGVPWPQGLNTTGDDGADERIGYIHLSALRCLLNPLDRNAEVRALKHGWLWGEYEIWQTDERSGKPVNCGTTAIGPSTPNPYFATYYNGGAGSPPWMGNINVYNGDGYHDWQNYNSLMDTSHQPSPWIAPLLRTGHAAFQDIAVASACAIAAANTSGGGNVTFNNVDYDCLWTFF